MNEPHQEAATPLRALFVRGVGWGLGGQAALQASRFAVAIILARLLAPADFGLVGMALVFSGIATVVCDLGLGTALVARPTLGQAERSTAFWMSAALGLTGAAAALALAHPIAAFYGEPRIVAIVAVLSIGFVVSSLATTQSALLLREFRFRELELAAIIATVVGAGVGIAAAVHGWGAWAIVAQQLVTGAVTTALLWVFSPWRPSLAVSREAFRELVRVGGHLSGTRVLFYLHRNVDNLLVGRFLGAPALGLYSVAYNLVLVPFGRLVDPVRGAFLPTLSKVQDDRARVAGLWLRITRLLAALLLPLMFGLVAVAPDAVAVVLGQRWGGAARVIQILAVVGVVQSFVALNSVVLPVLGETRALFRFSVLTFAASVGGFVAGLPFGIVGVACGYLCANLLVVPVYTSVTARATGLSPLSPLRAVRGILEASFGMFVIVLAARFLLLAGMHMSAGARLALLAVVGVVTYALLCAWREPELVRELRHARKPKRAVAATPSLRSADGSRMAS